MYTLIKYTLNDYRRIKFISSKTNKYKAKNVQFKFFIIQEVNLLLHILKCLKVLVYYICCIIIIIMS